MQHEDRNRLTLSASPASPPPSSDVTSRVLIGLLISVFIIRSFDSGRCRVHQQTVDVGLSADSHLLGRFSVSSVFCQMEAPDAAAQVLPTAR